LIAFLADVEGLHITATPVTPTELVDVDLGHVPHAEGYLHESEYYLTLWNDVLERRRAGMTIIYNPSGARAKIIRNADGAKILAIPCQHPRKVKGYYIAFRLLGDDVVGLVRFLHSAQRDELAAALISLSGNSTPPSNMVYDSTTDFDILARHHRRRWHECCVIM